MPNKPGTGHVKPYIVDGEQKGFTSLNPWGKKKYWRNTSGGLKQAKAHAGSEAKIDVGSFTEEKMKGPDPCWKGYKMVGKKTKNGKQVPNCVPEEVGQMTTSSSIPANNVGSGEIAGLGYPIGSKSGEPPGKAKITQKPLKRFKDYLRREK